MSAEDVRRASTGSMDRLWNGLDYLRENLHRVPALVVPCIEGRTDGLGADRQYFRAVPRVLVDEMLPRETR